MDTVRGDIRIWDEDGEFDQEDCERGHAKLGVAERLEVDGGAGLFVGREALLKQ